MSSLLELDTDKMLGSGIIIRGTAGETLGARKLVYLCTATTWMLADADSSATMPVVGLTMEPATIGQTVRIMLHGFIGDTSWVWTVGGEIYASTTAGELTQTVPSAIGDIVQKVGIAYEPDIMLFYGKSGGGDRSGCATIAGATAFVGFDSCKEPYANYFLCDGTNAEATLEAAMAYANGLGGGKILIENGDYRESGNHDITVPDDIHLVGESMEYTVLGSPDGYFLLRFNGVSNCSIENLTITVNTAAPNLMDIYIYGANPSDIVIRRVKFVATGNYLTWAINIASATNIHVADCVCDSDYIGYFAYVSAFLGQSYFLRNYVHDTDLGILLNSSEDVTISQNVFVDAVDSVNMAAVVIRNLGTNNNVSITENKIRLWGHGNVEALGNALNDMPYHDSVGNLFHMDSASTFPCPHNHIERKTCDCFYTSP